MNTPDEKTFTRIVHRYEKSGCHYCGKRPREYFVGTVGKAWRAACPEHAEKLHTMVGRVLWTSDGEAPLLATPKETLWSVDDMLFFLQNPHRTHRMRDAYDGEWDHRKPQPLPAGYVLKSLVRQLEPGARMRVPWGRLAGIDEGEEVPDEVVHALFDFAYANPGKTPDAEDLAAMEAHALSLLAAAEGRPQ